MNRFGALLVAALAVFVGVVPASADSRPPYPFDPNMPTLTVVPNPVAPNTKFRAEARWFCPKVAVVFRLINSSGTTLQTSKSIVTNTSGAASTVFNGVPVGTYTVRASQQKPSSGNLARTCKVSITANTTLVVEVDSTPPGPPQNFDAAALSPTSIKLTWTAASGGPNSYRIERSTSSNTGPWTLLTTVAATSTLTYTNTGLTPSTTYHYRIVAIDLAGNVSTPVIDSATTTAVPTINLTAYASVAGRTKIATLTWTGNTGSVDVYRMALGKLSLLRRALAAQQYTDKPGSTVKAATYYVCPTGVKPPAAGCGNDSVVWP